MYTYLFVYFLFFSLFFKIAESRLWHLCPAFVRVWDVDSTLENVQTWPLIPYHGSQVKVPLVRSFGHSRSLKLPPLDAGPCTGVGLSDHKNSSSPGFVGPSWSVELLCCSAAQTRTHCRRDVPKGVRTLVDVTCSSSVVNHPDYSHAKKFEFFHSSRLENAEKRSQLPRIIVVYFRPCAAAQQLHSLYLFAIFPDKLAFVS